jgi:hypothetical protein
MIVAQHPFLELEQFLFDQVAQVPTGRADLRLLRSLLDLRPAPFLHHVQAHKARRGRLPSEHPPVARGLQQFNQHRDGPLSV